MVTDREPSAGTAATVPAGSPDLAAAAEEVAADIRALGVPAVVDSRDLELPGAWVTVGAIGLDYMTPTRWAVSWEVFLIAPDLGTPQALLELGRMLGLVAGPLHAGDVTPQAVVLANHSADPLPALSFTLQTTISEGTGI